MCCKFSGEKAMTKVDLFEGMRNTIKVMLGEVMSVQKCPSNARIIQLETT